MRYPIIVKALLLTVSRSIAATTLLLLAPALIAAQELPLSASLHTDLKTERMFSRAEAGYVDDQIKLARAFQLGTGVGRDPAEAARWFLKAANFGSPMAQTEIGYLYMRGEGLSRDEQQAFKWFQRAAAADYAPAQYDLAYLLLSGQGTGRDFPAGATWLAQAAHQGFAPAQVNLAVLYSRGIGVERNEAEAHRWCQEAAKQQVKLAEADDLIAPAKVAGREAGSRVVFTIEVEDVDALCAELTARGAVLLNGPMDRPWGIRTASFSDPGGHIWEIAH